MRTDAKRPRIQRNSFVDRRSQPWREKPLQKAEKRRKQEEVYAIVCAEIDADALASGDLSCFFCGKDIRGKCDHHHLRGRDGSLLTDRKYIVRAHNTCHVELYHQSSIWMLMQQEWWLGFMGRLKERDEKTWWGEIRKVEKYLDFKIKQFIFET